MSGNTTPQLWEHATFLGTGKIQGVYTCWTGLRDIVPMYLTCTVPTSTYTPFLSWMSTWVHAYYVLTDCTHTYVQLYTVTGSPIWVHAGWLLGKCRAVQSKHERGDMQYQLLLVIERIISPGRRRLCWELPYEFVHMYLSCYYETNLPLWKSQHASFYHAMIQTHKSSKT